jgi:zinc transport system ATP-binding protein
MSVTPAPHNYQVQLVDISFAYDGKTVLKDVNLAISPGSYVGVIGPNGGGKTTLLKIVLGLLKPTKGQVLLFGQNQQDFHEWPKVGYVPQRVGNSDNNYPETVESVVAMGLLGKKGLYKHFQTEDYKQVKSVLTEMGLTQLKSRLIGNLSGGQQQRAYIARALVSNPQILFLDEPTTGIDLESQEEFYDILRHLNRDRNLTIVVVSHDVDVIVNEVTELVCLNQKLVYHGHPKQFLKTEYLEKLYGKNVKLILHGH